MPVETELYDILGVSANASSDEIKKAYRKKALESHPDKGGDQEMFKKVNAANEILSNPEKRALYDSQGKNGLRSSGQVPDDVLSAMFGHLFQNMNGGFGGIFQNVNTVFRHIRKTLSKTQTTYHTYPVSLEDLCTRRVVRLRISRSRVCSCFAESSQSCSECKGAGSITQTKTLGPGMIQQIRTPCQRCKGEGAVYSSCQLCSGGIIEDSKILELFLTPDMKDGYQYVFSGEGNQDRNYIPGDFVVVIKYKSHDFFKVNDQNLLYTKELSLRDALCGHSFSLTHPSGEVLTLSTEDVTTPETVRTIPEKGLTTGSSLQISYRIMFPAIITKEQKEGLTSLL